VDALELLISKKPDIRNDIAKLRKLVKLVFILASAKKKNYFIVARIWSHAGHMANDETIPNSTLASIKPEPIIRTGIKSILRIDTKPILRIGIGERAFAFL
jgi:hypothetical protein